MTSTGTLTLSSFLLARIAEDERIARGAWINGDRWRFNDDTGAVEVPSDSLEWRPTTAYMFDATADEDEFGVRITAMCDGDHMCRWDPARVLAECEAKRRIVELHKIVTEDYTRGWWADADAVSRTYVHTGCDHCRSCGVDGDSYVEDGPCDTLRLLALPYADHPDYREEWRP